MRRRRHQQDKREIEDNKNTLSDFPDSILLHILSFLNAKDAVGTCLLSTRWKHLWRSLPTLNLSSSNFRTIKCFSKFVSQILTLRDSSMSLNALDFERRGTVHPHLLIRIVGYAASHGVNRLRISCISCSINFIQFPPPSFSCPSLTSLELEYQNGVLIFPNTLNLPALTYLKLHNSSFCSGNDGCFEPFSTFNKLNTLILHKCRVSDPQQPLCISNNTLLNLSIHSDNNIYRRYSNIELFAPSLCTFAVTCNSFQKLSGSHLSSIKQVCLVTSVVMYPVETTVGMGILNWLIEMTGIKSLTVCPTTLEALSLVPNISKLKLPSLYNLKSLQLNVSLDAYRFSPSSWRDIKKELAGGKSWKENAKLREAIKARLMGKYSSIIDGMIEFLLQNSPSAKVEVQTHSRDTTFFSNKF